MEHNPEVVTLEAQLAPSPTDERVGFAVTHGRPAVAVMFPIDDEVESSELGSEEEDEAQDE